MIDVEIRVNFQVTVTCCLVLTDIVLVDRILKVEDLIDHVTYDTLCV